MITLKGKYNEAKVYTDNIGEKAVGQIIELCNQEFSKGSKIRIMPDTHAGSGCTIGTTMTIKEKVVPNLVGVDIGCGMEVIKLSNKKIDFEKLDEVIRNHVPSGTNVRNRPHRYSKKFRGNEVRCGEHVDMKRAMLSIGTLGGGNHFIEVNEDDDGSLYLVIHSGSRHLGKQVAEYYQKLAYRRIKDSSEFLQERIKYLRNQGRENEIEEFIKNTPVQKVSKQLAYVEGRDFRDYINDMKIVQEFAVLNRKAMIDVIVEYMNFDIEEQFTTIHNYIDIENRILRKGAISAQKGEKVIIPINMRDGSLICVGKGNEDWNYSAPHGAGRIMSRSHAKNTISVKEFKDSMKDVWTTSVHKGTIDESPMVYKPMDEIMKNIRDSVEIINIIKPLYNFKAN